MSMNTTIVCTWPTVADTEPTLIALRNALDLLDGLTEHYKDMINLDSPDIFADGVSKPSLAEVGLLSSLIERLRVQAEDLSGPVTELEEVRVWASLGHAQPGGAS
jgi:hypothetical protein